MEIKANRDSSKPHRRDKCVPYLQLLISSCTRGAVSFWFVVLVVGGNCHVHGGMFGAGFDRGDLCLRRLDPPLPVHVAAVLYLPPRRC